MCLGPLLVVSAVADVGAGGSLNFHRVYVQLLPASFHTSLLISSCPYEVRTAGIFNIRPSLTQHNPSCQSLCKMVCFQTCTSLATKKKAPGICRSFNCRGVSQDETFGIKSHNMMLTWVQNWMSHAILFVAICQRGKKVSICSLCSA